MSESELRIFTLNCWGMPLISKFLKERMRAIADVLASGNYDLVCMQEVWNIQDYIHLKKCIKDALPFSHYFHSGVFGSGLCIFSKFAIQQVFFHHWPVNGYVHKIQHGDWFGGKGIGLCCIKIGNLKVNLYTAHLHAQYHEDDEYYAHRIVQAINTAHFIKLTSENCDIVILGGDLNTEPNSLPYRIICSEAQLEDSFIHSSETVPLDSTGTNESNRNSFSDPQRLKRNIHGKRIDYILFRTSPNIQVNSLKYQLPLPSCVPNCQFSYSDHEAVSTTIVFKENHKASSFKDNYEVRSHELTLNEGLSVCNEALEKLTKNRQYYATWSIVLFLLLMAICSVSLPYEMHTVFKLIFAVISICLCFTVFMTSMWNRMEVNAIMSGKLAMELSLSQCKDNERVTE